MLPFIISRFQWLLVPRPRPKAAAIRRRGWEEFVDGRWWKLYVKFLVLKRRDKILNWNKNTRSLFVFTRLYLHICIYSLVNESECWRIAGAAVDGPWLLRRNLSRSHHTATPPAPLFTPKACINQKHVSHGMKMIEPDILIYGTYANPGVPRA